ncbi:hypothetical protein ScPMuIL_000742 [Solemya velum]
MHKAAKLLNLLAIAGICTSGGQEDKISTVQYTNLTGSQGYNIDVKASLLDVDPLDCNSDVNIRQNFHPFLESGLNDLISRCLTTSYQYLTMAYHFDRADQAYAGFRKFFKLASDQEQENAKQLMTYIHKRGGSVKLGDITASKKNSWSEALDAMEGSLELERGLTEDIIALHSLGKVQMDPHVTHFLENGMLEQKVHLIKKIADYIQQLRTFKIGQRGLGNFIFDRTLQDLHL